MNRFKKIEYLKHEIMGQNRHHFIYGYNNEERKAFIEKVVSEYPVKIDCNSPAAIYLHDFGLPKMPVNNLSIDRDKIDIICREYLSFLIASSILLKSKENLGIDLLNSRMKKIFNMLNKLNENSNIFCLEDLVQAFEQSKLFYREYYIDYLNNSCEKKSIKDLSIPFLHLEFFISQYKRALNNDSYFCLFAEKQNDIALSSTKAVNALVNSRINKDISMKVVVEPGIWDSYIDFNDQFIEAVHDYGIIELDNSQVEYVRKLKNQNI